MYKDMITYELADNISSAHLLNVAEQIANEWMKLHPGFIKWEIHTNNDGTYTDIVYWASEADAKTAEKDMANIPIASQWYGCYKQGSISSKNLHLMTAF